MLDSWGKFVDVASATALGLIAVVYRLMNRRIDAMETLSETLVTKDSFAAHVATRTDQIVAIETGRYAQIEELARSTEAYRSATERRITTIEEASVRTEARLNAMDERSTDRHIELLNAIHAVGRK